MWVRGVPHYFFMERSVYFLFKKSSFHDRANILTCWRNEVVPLRTATTSMTKSESNTVPGRTVVTKKGERIHWCGSGLVTKHVQQTMALCKKCKTTNNRSRQHNQLIWPPEAEAFSSAWGEPKFRQGQLNDYWEQTVCLCWHIKLLKTH